MVTILAKIFIREDKGFSTNEIRQRYGVLCGAVGIFLNIVLFGIKVFAGLISSSVAIIADAFNNLGDAGSSIISLIGFKMAGMEPDPEHPFGHGRIEYVTGLIISMLIILMGFELGKSSIDKIIHPSEVVFSRLSFLILIIAIFIKLYMYAYNKKISAKLGSAAMKATAIDSFTDSVATTIVLFAMLVGEFTKQSIDGYCGLLVAVFILYAGFSSAKDTLDPLLGSKPNPEFVNKIEQFAKSSPYVLDIHDLVIHDYGPGRMMITFHAEVPSDGNILTIHDEIDNIERKLRETLGCEAVIHMDPVEVNDEVTSRMKKVTKLLVQGIDESFMIHDFRMVMGPTHTNLIFDVVVPFGYSMSDGEVAELIRSKVRQLPGNYYAVLNIDKPYA